MSSVEVVAVDDETTPLLQSISDDVPRRESAVGGGGEITASAPVDDEPEPGGSTAPEQRLESLDVFRGLTVALMILVDDAGKAFPSINHAPWFGVTLADFVMPFFLFGVGVSVSLVFKKIPSKSAATKKVVMRSIKLFLLGLILQGLLPFAYEHPLSFSIPLSIYSFLRSLSLVKFLDPRCFLCGTVLPIAMTLFLAEEKGDGDEDDSLMFI